MQPEPSSITTSPFKRSNQETSIIRHHGSSSLAFDSSSSNADQQTNGNICDASGGTTSVHSGSAQTRRLSRSSRVVSINAPAHIISQYENALSPTLPNSEYEGPAFKVIKKKGGRSDAAQLDRFPNEVLTHILSHLPASSLSAVSLVSQRFYSLVTTPHAWRVAFSRYFPGQDATEELLFHGNHRSLHREEARESLKSELRVFTRLTALASWRSEYVLRTRLLRSLARGKPALAPSGYPTSRSNAALNNSSPVLTYNSQLYTTINHIHAVWNNGRKDPRFIHGADETGHACSSDPGVGKVDAWGLSDPQALPQFADLHPGDTMYGLGRGSMIGVPNVMDVSQPHGMVYGEGFPGGLTYFRSIEEQRGRFLGTAETRSEHSMGIPSMPRLVEGICSVWIAKSKSVPLMSAGCIGIITGSSCGIVTAYSLGHDNIGEARIAKGDVTAKWVLSPGVPITAIVVDESYDSKRKASGRIWAVVLNALGEVFYLDQMPRRAAVERNPSLDDSTLTKSAWQTGRSVYWNFVEPSRREARDDTYREFEYDGSYSPRTSSDPMNLSMEQISAETQEIEKFLAFKPARFQRICHGWDMRRRLEVDFGGDDGYGAGENIIIISCGVEDGLKPKMLRYNRIKAEQASFDQYPAPVTPPVLPATATMASLFGGGETKLGIEDSASDSPKQSATPEQRAASGIFVEEWRTSILALPSKTPEITTSSIDMSTLALLTASEDPLLTAGGSASVSSPFATPDPLAEGPMKSLSNVPGHRARFIAIGTKTGSILIWNMRGNYAANTVIVNEISPVRTIVTDSPQISCLALTSLYLVHGGNDGLVQTWDPLASTMQPIRTLHSRFSSRARRRLVQAEASVQGVGINLYAAGALSIDPDPTILRGMVSLGTHLRYWSYSSNGADSVSSKKRQLRKSSERGHNGTMDRFVSTGRGVLMDYIATEQEELEQEKERRAREEARLRGRFGVDFADMSEEEAIQYAELISQEAYEQEELRKVDNAKSRESFRQNAWSTSIAIPEASETASTSTYMFDKPESTHDSQLNHDLEEAIRLSLMDDLGSNNSPLPSGYSPEYEVPIKFKQKKSKRSESSSPPASNVMSSIKTKREDDSEIDDLEFALQLSLAEEESRKICGGASDQHELTTASEGDKKGKSRVV